MSHKTMSDFTVSFGLKLVGVIAILGVTALYCQSRYMIGFDDQKNRCLEEKYFLIDRWKKPALEDLERGDLVAIRMSASQTPANAKWPAGQTMIKRLIANSEGDQMNVGLGGVVFTDGDETWSWGTALEAARGLGQPRSKYVRTVTLAENEAFLMGDLPMSYDSRYYGAVDQDQVMGAVLWAF